MGRRGAAGYDFDALDAEVANAIDRTLRRGIILSNHVSSVVWQIRVNADGLLEFNATRRAATSPGYETCVTFNPETGEARVAGPVTPAVGFSDPGR